MQLPISNPQTAIRTIRNYYPAAIFLLLVSIIFAANYLPGTYLLGWDSFQTELYPRLGLERALFSVWQEYQSFGLVSGMAHAADLVRAVFIFLLSYAMPNSLVRYFFHFFMLFIGGLGAYYLTLKLLDGRRHSREFSIISGFFYILNLGTLQIFAVPFEPFSTFFGMLPWELLVFINYTEDKGRLINKNLLVLVAVNLLATPQAALQTLFVVYMLVLGVFSFGRMVSLRALAHAKRLAVGFAAIIIVNLFWIFPQIYFLSTSVDVVDQSKINQLATDVVISQNLEKGDIFNFTRMEGFYFDLFDAVRNPIFSDWQIHTDIPAVMGLQFVFFGIALFGALSKSKFRVSAILLLLLFSVVLLSNTPGFSTLNATLRQIKLLNQMFRSPFTKFIVPYSLVLAILLGIGANSLYELFARKFSSKIVLNSTFMIMLILSFVLISMKPAFTGSFFADANRAAIPRDYFELMAYLNEQDKTARVALLPDYTFWGWYKNDWGYEGSGFLWYGIKQPVVSRTFDVWSNESESYFWEIKDAIEAVDIYRFEQVLAKYDVKYLVMDYTLLPISASNSGLQYDQLEQLLSESTKIRRVFEGPNIELYEVESSNSLNGVSVVSALPSIGPATYVMNKDFMYLDNGTYKATSNPDKYYPFVDMFTQTQLPNKRWELLETSEFFILESDLPEGFNSFEYAVPDITEPLKSEVFLGDGIKTYSQNVDVSVTNERVKLTFGKDLIQRIDITKTRPQNCSRHGGGAEFDIIGDLVNVTSYDRGVVCFGYESPLLDHWNGYIIKVSSDNTYGKPLFFYVIGNKVRRQSKVEANLVGGEQYFTVEPGNLFDDGYIFAFQNQSYIHQPSSNVLSRLEIYLLPSDFIRSFALTRTGAVTQRAEFAPTSSFTVDKASYFKYLVSLPNSGADTLILNQSFDSGWIAYEVSKTDWLERVLPSVYGKKIGDHFVVSSWANGWDVSNVDDKKDAILLYVPQYLQLVGFGILGFAVLASVFIYAKNTNSNP